MPIQNETRNVEWEYLQWLGTLVGNDLYTHPDETYLCLLEQLYRKEFDWRVANDDNRIEDALHLRVEFQNLYGGTDIVGGASLLEVMIVLARRLAFDMSEESDDVGYWFRILLSNTELIIFHDAYYWDDYSTPSAVDNILNTIIFRNYGPDGSGGFFPLNYPKEDQRGVELWYQMAAYVLERSGY